MRLYLFVMISLPLFHWAHRFRYTLYDGLQLYHLTVLIAVLCYGAALVGTAVAAYTPSGTSPDGIRQQNPLNAKAAKAAKLASGTVMDPLNTLWNIA